MAGLFPVPPGFSIAIAQDLPTIVSPVVPLELVFRTLIGNALDHHDRTSGRIEISWQDQDPFVTLSVADDGPGIDPPFQDRVFQMFQTLKSKDQSGGSGMGLAIVRKLVEGQGGKIWIESQTEGRGAVFRFLWRKSATNGTRP